jgi:hypothetical protein
MKVGQAVNLATPTLDVGPLFKLCQQARAEFVAKVLVPFAWRRLTTGHTLMRFWRRLWAWLAPVFSKSRNGECKADNATAY